MDFNVARTPPRPTKGYDVYWAFAAKRQQIYFRRLVGDDGPLTTDPVLANHRFTNAYRASDRVSQFLITDVIYDEDRSWVDTFARILFFKIFNRIDTWTHIRDHLGEPVAEHLMSGQVDEAVAQLASRGPVYSAAYIMPPPRNREGRKFQRHLGLLRDMIAGRAHERITDANSMSEAFSVLSSYDSVGPFLAYQFVTDLNYSPHLGFGECDFVVAGPGALRGMRKCFSDPGDLCAGDLIRWTMEQQFDAFGERDLPWHDLWGRHLQLIDAQNIFCEVDKYTREANPELTKYAPGTRIKQRYRRANPPMTAWFPPKWGLNGRAPGRRVTPEVQTATEQLALI